MLVSTRPLTAVGIAAPYVVYSLGRVVWAALRARPTVGAVLRPLLALSAVTLALSLTWPAFNYAVTARADESFPAYLGRFLRGDKDTNLYRYIWDYDRVGFGPGHGRRATTGHTLDIGWQHTKTDLECAARDLFGWALPPEDGLTVEQDACLVSSGGTVWVLLPLGVLLTARRAGRGCWPRCRSASSRSNPPIGWGGGNSTARAITPKGLGAPHLLTAAELTRSCAGFDARRSGQGGLRPGA